MMVPGATAVMKDNRETTETASKPNDLHLGVWVFSISIRVLPSVHIQLYEFTSCLSHPSVLRLTEET